MDNEKIIENIFVIMADIESREYTNNCQSDMTWNELCDMGIDLFNQLKI